MKLKFLIYISYSYALPIGEPLEKEILKQGHEVLWFSDLKNGAQSIANKRNRIYDVQELLQYQPHIVLTITDAVPDFIPGLKVQIFHGFNAEKRSFKRDHFRIRGLFDLYCTQGPSTTSVFKELQQKSPHFEAIETGWSKVDPLFPIEKNTQQNAHRPPTIFIASTFTERLSLAYNEGVFKKIEELAQTGKYFFIMVLHPKLPADIIKKWRTLEGEYFSYYQTTNLIPLFRKSDIMFSDTTSAIQEFGLQGKPIVTFKHHVPKDYLLNITKIEEIEPALQKALTYPQEILEKLATFNQELHPYNDGESSKRVVNTTIDFLQADKSHLKKKPLNLVRKLKLRNRLHFYTFKSYRDPYTFKIPKSSPITREPVTAIIPTKNEIHNIEAVIASVSFADEIFVIDSYSTDGTYEKAKEKADKVVQRKFKYFADQKNWAISQAENEWILLVDADERVTPVLRLEILKTLENPSKENAVGYWIGRKNYFMGKQVKHSGWKNDKVIRLFRKSKCRYRDQRVHEEIQTDGKVLKLQNKLFHNTYSSLDEYIEKMNFYAGLQAEDYDKTTGRLTAYHFVFKPLWRFFKHYIIQGGFRDGVVGLSISYIQGYTVFMRYAKLWLLRKSRK